MREEKIEIKSGKILKTIYSEQEILPDDIDGEISNIETRIADLNSRIEVEKNKLDSLKSIKSKTKESPGTSEK